MPGSSQSIVRNLLWIDGGAGLIADATGLALNRSPASLYLLPGPLLVTMSVANLLFASYALTLASRRRRPPALIAVLVFANGAWGCHLEYLLLRHSSGVASFGHAHLALEALFVAGLAGLEWRYRHALVQR